MSLVWDDPRVRAGMQQQLTARAQQLTTGERHRGWKVAFNTQAAFDRLGVDAPLIGFFTDRNVLERGADIRVDGWTKPVLEPEIALKLGRDLGAGASYDEATAAIAAVAPGLEVADIDAALMDDLTAMLAGDIFHRYMVLGDFVPAVGIDFAHLNARVACGGTVRAVVENPASVSGDLIDVLRHTADYLAGVGQQLSAGDVVMTGSLTPVIDIGARERWTYSLDPLGTVDVSFT